MGQSFRETAHLHTDTKKFDENYAQIDWGHKKERKTDATGCSEMQRTDRCDEKCPILRDMQYPIQDEIEEQIQNKTTENK